MQLSFWCSLRFHFYNCLLRYHLMVALQCWSLFMSAIISLDPVSTPVLPPWWSRANSYCQAELLVDLIHGRLKSSWHPSAVSACAGPALPHLSAAVEVPRPGRLTTRAVLLELCPLPWWDTALQHAARSVLMGRDRFLIQLWSWSFQRYLLSLLRAPWCYSCPRMLSRECWGACRQADEHAVWQGDPCSASQPSTQAMASELLLAASPRSTEAFFLFWRQKHVRFPACANSGKPARCLALSTKEAVSRNQ